MNRVTFGIVAGLVFGVVDVLLNDPAEPAVAYGNWNDCPPPEVHTALCLSWYRRFGATLVAMGSDTIEMMVENPPRTKDSALALAEEHYFYCTDIVDQGCGTIERLAARLLGGGVWSFWWD